MSINKRELIIHIGTEKTATSTIQKMLSDNRDELARNGIIYPSCAGINGGSQWRFISCFFADKEFDGILKINDEKNRIDFKNRIKKQLDLELENNINCKKVIISSEHFHSRLIEQKEILKLKEFFSPYFDSFKVVVYFRRQDRLGVSSYSTKIKVGSKKPLLFPNIGQKKLRYYYDHFQIYKNWSDVFGRKNVIANIFENSLKKDGGILKCFADICEFSLLNLSIPPKENEALNHISAISMLEMNKLNAEKNLAPFSDFRMSFYEFISTKISKKFYPCTKNEAEVFFKSFHESNESLRKIAFPELSFLFDSNFSDYPETVDFEADQEMARIIVDIWSSKKQFLPDKLEQSSDKIFSSQEIIESLYKSLLDRNPDADGFNSWVKNLEQKRDISNVVSKFISSTEFINKKIKKRA